jgi:hypothetical protein
MSRARGNAAVRARILQCCWRDNEGSALLEGAILLPVLVALMFGVYEFSWFFYQQHVMAAGLREAARYLARSSNPCDPASPAWAADAALAQRLASTGRLVDAPARIKGWETGMVQIACSPVENLFGVDGLRIYRGGAIIYVVTVSARINDPSLGFFYLFGLNPPVISASHSERAIGPG